MIIPFSVFNYPKITFSTLDSKYYISTLISNLVILQILLNIGLVVVPKGNNALEDAFNALLAPSAYPLVNIAYGDNLNSNINSYNGFIGTYLYDSFGINIPNNPDTIGIQNV